MLPDATDLAINFVPWTNANSEFNTCPDNDNNCFVTRLQVLLDFDFIKN